MKQKHNIVFIYKDSTKPHINYNTLCEKVITLVRQIYSLPDSIEIQFENMGHSVYGMTMLDPRFPNRIRLNQTLSLEEFILPLTHELLHLHQTFTNKLQSRPGGRILWENETYKVDTLKLSYQDYQQLPWELDVAKKQQKLLQFLQQNARKLRLDTGPK